MAEKPSKPQFDVGSYLRSKGYEFSRVDDAGQYKVITPGGDEATFDSAGFFKKKGIDPSKYDVSFNDTSNPLDISPLDVKERSKLALGNVKGSLAYLKGKFDQVAVEPEGGILVKRQGVWHKVDPSGLGSGDAWDMAKELGRDIAEGAVAYGPSAALSTIGAGLGAAALGAGGAAAGGAAGAPAAGVGAVPGAIAGGGAGAIIGGVAGAAAGGALGEGIRTSLGRVVGTYEATPEEQLKDIGWEGLLNAGGQVIGLGVKPGLAALKGALGSVASKATPAGKDALAQVWGLSTGAGPTRVRYAMDAPDEVVNYLGKVAKGSSAIDAENTLKDLSIAEAKSLMGPARSALSSKFGALQGDFLDAVPANMEFKVQDMLKTTMMQMEQAGLGKIVEEKGIGRFKLFNQAEIDKKLAAGNIPDVIDSKSLDAIDDFVTEMNKFSAVPVLKGRSGAEATMKIKRAMSDAFYSITDDKAPNIKRSVAKYSSELNDYLGGVFDKSKAPGLAERYVNMNNTYTKFSSAVQEADRMMRETNGPELFVNKLTSLAGANRSLKGTAGALAELLGPAGEKRIQNILSADAARGFVGYMPNLGKLSTAGAATLGAGGALAAGSAVANPLLTAGVASQTSPRLVLKQIQYMKKFSDFIKGMSPAQKDQFLRSPEAVGTAVRTLFTSFANEEKQTEELLKQGGVVP